MERVTGIGGFFFTASDDAEVSRWYAMVDQLRAAGLEVEVDDEAYPNGRFALLHDPEGNAVQLWEPSG